MSSGSDSKAVSAGGAEVVHITGGSDGDTSRWPQAGLRPEDNTTYLMKLATKWMDSQGEKTKGMSQGITCCEMLIDKPHRSKADPGQTPRWVCTVRKDKDQKPRPGELLMATCSWGLPLTGIDRSLPLRAPHGQVSLVRGILRSLQMAYGRQSRRLRMCLL